MKIAVTYEDGQVFQHFGHTEFFRVYDVENGAVTHRMTVRPTGAGHGALAAVLAKLGVDTLICGGLGGGARMALNEAGIRVYAGVTGEADAAVEALLAGTLSWDPQAHCDHHGEGHGEGHSCGGGCGGHDHAEDHSCGHCHD